MNKTAAQPITEVWQGSPYPLGATWDGQGVNFAVFSRHAERVELCLFYDADKREIQRIGSTVSRVSTQRTSPAAVSNNA